MNATSLLIGLLVGLPLGGSAVWLIAGRRNDAGQSEAVSQAVNEAIIALRDDAEAVRQAAIDQLNQINATAH
jgi:gas vesicle protein